MKLANAVANVPWVTGLAVLAAVFSPTVLALNLGWYGGVSLGQSKAQLDEARMADSVLGGGFTYPSLSKDARDTGYKLFGGYRLNRNFAIEGGYFDLGRSSFTATTLPAGTLDGSIRLKGLNLDAVGILPVTDQLSIFARLGLNHADTSDTFTGTGFAVVANPNPDKRDTNLKAGVGLQYDVNTRLGLRLEAERYRINDAVGHRGNVDLVSLGLVYSFGVDAPRSRVQEPKSVASMAPPPKPAPLPAPKVEPKPEPKPVPPPPKPVIAAAPLPAPAPILVVAPTPIRMAQYCSILDIQFEINQDEIQREERERLAVLGAFMKKYPDTTALIEGHTDDVGQEDANQRLSQRRAESVAAYLTDQLQIAPARLSAVGYGETRPVADNGSEEGKRQNRRIDAVVACVTDIAGLSVRSARVTMALLIEFDRNKAELPPQYGDELRKVADFLRANPSVTASVEGHTGNLQGSPAVVQEISQRRAQNVVNYLVDNQGIAASRLTAEGFGKTRRFAYNTSQEGQQENRRVNVIFTYPR